MTFKNFTLSISIALLGTAGISTLANASEPFIGEIQPVGFNFCPRGFAEANGQLLAISQYSALFSLYGTIYGGDGRTTFALPDLRSRVPIHMGTGPGLSSRPIGSRGGAETNTMTVGQMPSHTHRAGVQTRTETANSTTPRKNSFSVTADNSYFDGTDPSGRFMNSNTIAVDNAGGGQSQNNMQPYLTINYCVALVGLYPSRS
ncbi:MAG: phage tail protein [Hellea sp.]|nr:phage tail protein [Hellea sp.]